MIGNEIGREQMIKRFLFLSSVLLVLTLTGCTKDNQVRILSISPDPSQPLYVGEEVKVMVNIEYEMVDPSGSITLVIQRGESGHPPLASAARKITQGSGQIEISTSFTVPDTKSIQVFTPLSAEGAVQTRVVDVRTYQVKHK